MRLGRTNFDYPQKPIFRVLKNLFGPERGPFLEFFRNFLKYRNNIKNYVFWHIEVLYIVLLRLGFLKMDFSKAYFDLKNRIFESRIWPHSPNEMSYRALSISKRFPDPKNPTGRATKLDLGGNPGELWAKYWFLAYFYCIKWSQRVDFLSSAILSPKLLKINMQAL